jgi:DNA polymerase-3 subunit epsilon
VATARSWLDEHPVFIDTETTGTGEYDQICEIAIVAPDGETIVDELVRPSRPIPQAATEVHGISDADVEDAPSMADLEPELEQVLPENPCCIYNADFDLRLLSQSATSGWLLDWPDDPSRVSCVMELAARWHGDWSDVHQSYTWISQEDAASELEIDVDELDDLHRARADAELCRRILHAIALRSPRQMQHNLRFLAFSGVSCVSRVQISAPARGCRKLHVSPGDSDNLPR